MVITIYDALLGKHKTQTLTHSSPFQNFKIFHLKRFNFAKMSDI